jgi:hypothetical protein
MRVEPIENIAPSSQPVVRKCCASGAVGLAEDVVPWDEKRMPKMLRSGNRNCCGRMLRVLGMSNGRDVALPGTHRWAGACDSGTWSRRTRAGKCCAKMLRRGRVLDARCELVGAFTRGYIAKKCCAGRALLTQYAVRPGLPPDGMIGTTSRRLRHPTGGGRVGEGAGGCSMAVAARGSGCGPQGARVRWPKGQRRLGGRRGDRIGSASGSTSGSESPGGTGLARWGDVPESSCEDIWRKP